MNPTECQVEGFVVSTLHQGEGVRLDSGHVGFGIEAARLDLRFRM